MSKSAPSEDPRFASLLRYGFDRALLQRWQDGLAQGRISLQHNLTTSPLLPPPAGTVRALPTDGGSEQQELERLGAAAIRNGELGVVILNGGMATRFGGVVKGIVDVLGPGRSFLQLAMQDIALMQRRHGGRIHVFLMNSYATEAATKAHFAQHHHFGLDPTQIHHFNQFVSVRLEKDGSIFVTKDGEISPYGPGHGDFPSAFRQSGALRALLAAGGKHVMVRNVDNLGARVSAAVLGHHIQSQCAATCELVPKHKGDVGGAPYLLDGRVQLVEQIRYPQGFDASIVDVFNCNTFTFRAEALDREFDLGWYYVEKSADGRKAVQMEHLIGELTRELSTNWLQVPRQGPASRFLAVKTPEDLAVVRNEVRALYPD